MVHAEKPVLCGVVLVTCTYAPAVVPEHVCTLSTTTSPCSMPTLPGRLTAMHHFTCALQIVGVIIATAGFAIAAKQFKSSIKDVEHSHGLLGVAIIALVYSQVGLLWLAQAVLHVCVCQQACSTRVRCIAVHKRVCACAGSARFAEGGSHFTACVDLVKQVTQTQSANQAGQTMHIHTAPPLNAAQQAQYV